LIPSFTPILKEYEFWAASLSASRAGYLVDDNYLDRSARMVVAERTR
jgi:hypothetical protein